MSNFMMSLIETLQCLIGLAAFVCFLRWYAYPSLPPRRARLRRDPLDEEHA